MDVNICLQVIKCPYGRGSYINNMLTIFVEGWRGSYQQFGPYSNINSKINKMIRGGRRKIQQEVYNNS